MSVKELKFKDEHNLDVIIKFENNSLWIAEWEFDRNEAHSLMLFLQEHLNSTISNELDKVITDEIKNKPKDIMR